ncbi:hypothetical protein PsorP6_011259 [Peronosclerospora sorghi]|uniref:Uncharacterized protein n=1 Tax=Peronosclerospora sorghi TaxID=230839 RepID=A0ACC0WLD0_9STRA|nr:hypothetical protein PsorP6_011259 [Peronosclerospora sorghi]
MYYLKVDHDGKALTLTVETFSTNQKDVRAHQRARILGRDLGRFEMGLEPKCAEFLLTFKSHLEPPEVPPKYARTLQEVANRERTSIPIALDDVQSFDRDDATFVTRITRNARWYLALFADAVDEHLPAPTRGISGFQDVLDVLRLARAQEVAQQRQLHANDGRKDPSPDSPTLKFG